MSKPLINILIRTSERPHLFDRLMKSIDYPVNVIVSIDTDEKYPKKYDVEIVRVKHERRRGAKHFPWNLYFNRLLARVKDGYVIYLDDDVELLPGVLKKIAENVKKNKLLIWKYRFANGRVIPEKQFWGKQPARQHIDSGCFAHHIEHAVKWDGGRAGDYRVARQLYQKIGAIWLDEVLVQAANNGDNGRKNDIILPG